MREPDFREFCSLLDDIAALMSRPAITPKQSAMFFRSMASYPLEAVRAALDAHMRDPQRGRFFPLPADLIAKIEEATNDRVSSDEAWAIAVRARDESDTVVWTEEMAQAWGVCKTVMDMGDEVGARMAFKSSYDRIVSDAKRERRPAVWIVSEGFDKDRRIAAVQQAEAAGLRLPSAIKQDVLLLAHRNAEPISMPPAMREKLAELRRSFSEIPQGPTRAEQQRTETERLKREAAQKAEAYKAQTLVKPSTTKESNTV